MNPAALVHAILDCEACGEGWPRLCSEHADDFIDLADEQDIAERRRQRSVWEVYPYAHFRVVHPGVPIEQAVPVRGRPEPA